MLAPFFEVKMVLVTLGFMLLTFGVFIPINYLAIEAIYEGMSPDLAQYLVAILNATRYVYTIVRSPTYTYMYMQKSQLTSILLPASSAA
jgi:hypothetical protein